MPEDRIVKPPSQTGLGPNLRDWQAERQSFSWEAARARLDGLPGGGLNICHEALDRHLGRRPGRPAGACAGSPATVMSPISAMPTWPARRRGSPPCCSASASPRATGCSAFPAGCRRSTSPRWARSGPGRCSRRCSPPSGRSRSARGWRSATRRSWSPPDTLYRRKLKDWVHEVDTLTHVLLIDAEAERGPKTVPLGPLMAEAEEAPVAPRPSPATWRCSTSPAAPPASPRA